MGHTHVRIGPDTSARVPDSRHDTPGGLRAGGRTPDTDPAGARARGGPPVNTPAAEPLVPPSGGPPQQPAAPPAPPGYGQQPGCAAQSAYAAPSWPQQAVASQPGWGT